MVHAKPPQSEHTSRNDRRGSAIRFAFELIHQLTGAARVQHVPFVIPAPGTPGYPADRPVNHPRNACGVPEVCLPVSCSDAAR